MLKLGSGGGDYHKSLLAQILQLRSDLVLTATLIGDTSTICVPSFLFLSLGPVKNLRGYIEDENFTFITPGYSETMLKNLKEVLCSGTCFIETKQSTDSGSELGHLFGNLSKENTKSSKCGTIVEDHNFGNMIEPIKIKPIKPAFINMLSNQPFTSDNQLGNKSRFCKTFEISHCSKKCTFSCSEINATWKREYFVKVKTLFVSENGLASKTKLLQHLKAQDNLGLEAKTFKLRGQSFCLEYFSYLTNCSVHILKTVLGKVALKLLILVF